MLSASVRADLREGAARLAVSLEEAQVDALSRYVELLLQWNAKLNLTAVTDPATIVDKHLLDSLALVPHVTGSRVIDVGTGPGLPAIVLAIARPDLAVTAIESIHKKVAFVRTVARELRLDLIVAPLRLETFENPSPAYDLAVSRATFEPVEWVDRGAVLVAPHGRLIAMLSARQAMPSAPAGFSGPLIHEYEVGGVRRRLACYDRA